MDIPQVGDQVRKAPTQAIRAVFAGIGKILLAADRPQSGPRPAGPKHAARGGRAPQTGAPGGRSPQTGAPGGRSHTAARGARSARTAAPGGQPPTAPPGGQPPQNTAATATGSQQWRSLDETGNVRLLSTEELTVGRGTVVAATPVPVGPGEETMAPAASQPLTGNVPVGAGFVVHELPLPGFDTMPVASIRARLRSLDVDQLHALLVRENKNAKRPEIIAMIERRIQKLEDGG